MKIKIFVNIFTLLLAFSLCVSCSTQQNEAYKLTSIADNYNESDNPLLALQYYIKGFIAAKNESNDYLAMRCAGNISILYNSFGNVKGSLQYNNIGYALSVKLNAIDAKSAFLTNYVTYYCNNRDLSNACKYYKELIKLKGIRNIKRHVYFCMYEHARIMKSKRNYLKALEIHSEALKYAQDKKMGEIFVLYQNSEIGNMMVLLHRYDVAVSLGKSCLENAKRLKNKELVLNAYKMLADAYIGLNNKEEAFEYLEKYHKHNTGVYNMPEFFSLQNDLYQYENNQHERKINNLLIVTLTITMLSVILIVLVITIAMKNKALRKAQVILVNKDKVITKLEEKNKDLNSVVENHIPEKLSYMIPTDQKDELFEKVKQIFEDVSVISNVDFNINKMSELTDSNVKYVSVVINKKYGKSFKNVLNEFRVKEACKMLSDDNFDRYTIKSIYESVGYRNAASFIRAFKTVTGMTPSTYQRIYREEL